MGTTGGTLPRASSEPAPSGYSPVDDAYKVIAVRNIGSSEYGQEMIPYVLTSSSAFIARSGDTGGRANSLITGATTTISLTVSTSTDGLSGAVDLGGYRIAAIDMSTAWTTADLTFAAASSSGGTYKSLYDDDHFETIIRSPGANEMISIRSEADAIAPLRFVKFRSGTAAIPVTQDAERTLTLILKG